MAEISSIEAEVSSRLAACSSVRCDRSVVALEISTAALATSLAVVLISAMVSERRCAVALALSFRSAKAPRLSLVMREVRSPCASSAPRDQVHRSFVANP